MALENADLLVVQKAGGGELRKTTVQQLLADIDVEGGAEVIISGSAPTIDDNIENGTLWWNTEDGNLYILYKNEDDESRQWVPATAASGGGSTGNLQEVTTKGNNTTNDITINTDKIVLSATGVITATEFNPGTGGAGNFRIDLLPNISTAPKA